MFDMFPGMKYVTGLCGSALLPKKAIMYSNNLNLQSQEAIFETENSSQNFRAVGEKPAIFFQNSFTLPGKSTAERGYTLKYLRKIRFKRIVILKKLLP